MSWRRLPPVRSPISPRALFAGAAAACALRPDDRKAVVAALCQRHGASDALLTDSGTSALILALRALVPDGGAVAFPGYACIDLTTAAIGAGVRVRIYDLDPMTLSPDMESVRRTIERGVDAIVVAHLFGYPADVVGVQEIAAAHGIPVIEDAAQGAGGSLRGRTLGSLADMSVLSFGRGKGTTAGSGGALLVKTPALAEWAQQTRLAFGTNPRGGREVISLAAQWLLTHPMLYGVPASIPALRLGEMVYHAPHKPRAMTDAAAAILPSAFRMDANEVGARRERANELLSRMKVSVRMSPVQSVAGGEPGYLRFAVLDSAGNASPCPELGAVRGYPLTLEQHVPLRPILAPNESAGTGATELRDRLFTLPTHSRVLHGDLGRLSAWLATLGEDSLNRVARVNPLPAQAIGGVR